MNITNEKLYEMVVGIKSDISDFKTEIKSDISDFKTEIKSDISDFKTEIISEMADFKAEIRAEIAEIKVAQSELRADIIKWGVALFVGSIVAMTSIVGVFLVSVVSTIAN